MGNKVYWQTIFNMNDKNIEEKIHMEKTLKKSNTLSEKVVNSQLSMLLDFDCSFFLNKQRHDIIRTICLLTICTMNQ